MLGFLAVPVADELLFGVLARTLRMLGASRVRFNLAAFGTPLPDHCASLPRGVAGLAATCLGGGAAELAREHTNLDYHLRWLSPGEGRQLTSYVLDGRPAEAWRRAYRPLLEPLPATLLFCTECARADVAARGWAAWRRQHQLPGVFYCASHAMPLRSSAVRARHQQHLVECPTGAQGGTVVACPFDPDTALRLARLVDLLRSDARPAPALRHVRAGFRRALSANGWLLADGRTSGHLWRSLSRRYGQWALPSLDLARSRRAMAELWTGRGERSWHPLLPILLIDFLGLTAAGFLSECSAGVPAAEIRRDPQGISALSCMGRGDDSVLLPDTGGARYLGGRT